ncbi:hypothetical protein ACLB2K_037336 [Fragaria x ananassa]
MMVNGLTQSMPPWAFKNRADYYKANPLFSVPVIVDDYDGFVGGCSKPTTVRLLEIDQPTLIEKEEILVVPESGSTKRKRKPKKTMEEVEEIKSNYKRPKPANGPSLRLSSFVGRGRGHGWRGRGRGRSTFVCGESQLGTELVTFSQAVDGVGLVIDRESSKVTDAQAAGFQQGYHVSPVNTAGGLNLWWRPNYKVEVVDYSKFFIDTLITHPGSVTPFRVTWMYGPPYGEDKAAFWEKWRQRNQILKTQNDSNQWIVEEKFIRLEFENQFRQTFTSSGLRDWGDALRGVAPVITDEMNDDLGRPFTYDEVRDAAFQLGALKAPGPDRFLGLFYHKF